MARPALGNHEDWPSCRATQSPESGVAVQPRGGCHTSGTGRKRDFIVAPYSLRDGDWEAELPRTCPCGDGCRVREHDRRNRVTGPRHPLIVVVCVTHKRYFTLYPPAYVPYGRRRLVPKQDCWKGTMFEAAADASDPNHERWSDIGEEKEWSSTQWRHIMRAGELLALSSPTELAEQAAMHLGVDLHVHERARQQYRAGDYRQRGRAVMMVLSPAVCGEGRTRRLLRAGCISDWCGRSFFADQRVGLLPIASF